jgi:ribosomal protein L37AE/L43A
MIIDIFKKLLSKKNNGNKQLTIVNNSNIDILDDDFSIIEAEYTSDDIFDDEVFYSETFTLSALIVNNSLKCLHCKAKMAKPSHADKWHCKTCNVAYSSYGNALIVHSDTLLNKYNNPLFTVIKTFPNTTNTTYTNKCHLSDCSFNEMIPSKIIPNLLVEISKFKCPCCNAKYEEIDHGDAWICNTCQTEFVSYGNSLKHTEIKTYLIKMKLENFDNDIPFITQEKLEDKTNVCSSQKKISSS